MITVSVWQQKQVNKKDINSKHGGVTDPCDGCVYNATDEVI